MFELVLPFLLTISIATHILDSLNFMREQQVQKAITLFLDQSYFSSLENYQVKATPVSEKQYPWIARVVHSRTADIPHVCTAVCIDKAVFITAARCIYTLKVNYTTIIYMDQHLETKAFVVPSVPTKQLFDDIGFIVVDPKYFKGRWAVIELFDRKNRTDKDFTWFSKLDFKTSNYKVVGYAMKKGIHRIKIPARHYNLTELNVLISLDICHNILTQYGKLQGFTVPCYHTCTFTQFQKNNPICSSYHGVEGGAIFDTTTNKLLGVATWGASYFKYELPVGFSVVNSDNFFKDLTCARRIQNDNNNKGLQLQKGYYQKLCDKT